MSVFNGSNWTTYNTSNSGLAGDWVTAIAVDEEGNKWFCTGVGVSKFGRSTWTTYTVENTSHRGEQATTVTKDTPAGSWSVPVGFANEVEADAALVSGYVMFGDDPAIYHYHHYLYDSYSGSIYIEPSLRQSVSAGTPVYAVDVGLASNYITAIAVDEKGDVWFGTEAGVSVFDGATWTTYTLENTSHWGERVTTVTRDTPAGRYYVLVDFASQEEADAALASGYVMFWGEPTIYCYVWYDAYLGSIHIHPSLQQSVSAGTPVYAVEVGLASNDIAAIAIDTEGSKWFGTKPCELRLGYANGGVSKFDGATWTAYTVENISQRGDQVTTVTRDTPVESRSVQVNFASEAEADAALASGYVMFGTDPTFYRYWEYDAYFGSIRIDPYLRRNAPAGTPVYAVEVGLASNTVRAVAIDKEGNRWFGTWDGVSKFDGAAWTSYNTDNSGLVGNNVQVIAVDEAGDKWFGTDAGVSKFHEEAEMPEYSIYLPIVLKNLSQ